MNKKVLIFTIELMIAIFFMGISTKSKELRLEQQEFVPVETAQKLYETGHNL